MSERTRIKLYAVYDGVSRELRCLHTNSSDGNAVRFFVTHYGYGGEDFASSQPLCLGYLDLTVDVELAVENFGKVFMHCEFVPRVLDWKLWRTPESKEDLLDPLGLTDEEKREAIENSIVNTARRRDERSKVQQIVDNYYSGGRKDE